MPDESSADAREAYLKNQQAVAAAAATDRRWSPLRVVAVVGAALTGALFIATVVSYYNDPQQDGPTNTALPAATSIALLATLFCVVLPYLLESRTVVARIRNVLIAAVVASVLALLCVGLFVSFGSLVADLAHDITH